MKKIITCILLSNLLIFCEAQNLVSNFADLWNIDTTLMLSIAADDAGQKNWVSAVYQDKLFFCRRSAFQPMADDYYACVYSVDLHTLAQDTLLIAYPKLSSSWKQEVQTCCVYSLNFDSRHLLLACDNQIMLYAKSDFSYKFQKRWFCIGVCAAYLYQSQIYALTDDKTKGDMKWLRYANDKAKQAELLKVLPVTLPFLKQFEPNRYFYVDTRYLYYLPPGRKAIQRYSLDAQWVDSLSIDYVGWKPFPPEFVETERKLPYGMQRISYALKNDYKQYTFAKSVEPLNDSLIYVTMNIGNSNQQENFAVLQMKRVGNEWIHQLYSLHDKDTSQVYSKTNYPFVHPFSRENVLLYPYESKLLQWVSVPENEDFYAKTVKEYRQYKDAYYKNHDPVLKLRILSQKSECKFHNYDNEEVQLFDLGHDKVILMVNRQPQCSACQKVLLQYLSKVDTSKVTVAVLFDQLNDYLSRRENAKYLSQVASEYYQPLYTIPSNDYAPYRSQHAYPAIFFWRKEQGVIAAFPTTEIFTSDYSKYEFSDSFLKMLDDFLADEN